MYNKNQGPAQEPFSKKAIVIRVAETGWKEGLKSPGKLDIQNPIDLLVSAAAD